MTVIDMVGTELRLPLGAGRGIHDGGELIFQQLDWGDDRIRMTIRAYGAPGRFGDPSTPTRDHSVVIPLSALQSVIDTFSSPTTTGGHHGQQHQ